MSGSFNPHLASEGLLGAIHYPKVALPKLNGVRGLNQEGRLIARSLKPIPNIYTRKRYSYPQLSGLDGELVVGDYFDEEVFTISTSGVMSIEGTPNVAWHVFDIYHPTLPYLDRLERRREVVEASGVAGIEIIPHCIITCDDHLVTINEECLEAGYEGVVLRDPNAPYRTGRGSSLTECFLRYCPWHTGEAIIIGIEEGEINNNPSVLNELGFLKKSTHKHNMVGSGRAGAFCVRDLKTNIEFKMPVPTDKLQQEVWDHKDEWLGKIVKYKFRPPVKKGGKPRFPQVDQTCIYVGIRSPLDMS